MMTDSQLLEEIKEAARGAGKIILGASKSQMHVSSKGGKSNFVTEYDDQVQEYLIERFSTLLPDAHFVGEEEGRDVFTDECKNGYTFVIDPIDGTTNFMMGYRISVTSIGLFKDGEPYIGVVYDPYSDRMFWAQKGMGAYENGVRISTSDEGLEHNLVCIGVAPYYGEEFIKNALLIGGWYLRRCVDVRRTGSAAYDLCMVASGRTGLFYEARLGLWDYAAAALIVEEAGGKVTDMRGNRLSWRGKSSLCAAGSGVAREEYLPPAEWCL